MDVARDGYDVRRQYPVPVRARQKIRASVSHHSVTYLSASSLLATMSSRLIASSSARASLFSVARRHATAAPKPLRWSPSRNAHIRRELAYPIEKGLGEFLPPAALKTLAVEYQDGLLQRLNDEVRGTLATRLYVSCRATRETDLIQKEDPRKAEVLHRLSSILPQTQLRHWRSTTLAKH